LSQREGIEYFRYMDDIIILAQSEKQYKRAKRILFNVLGKLRLKLSPSKTKMGTIDSPFHFLGVNFEVTQIPQNKLQVSVQPHPRTCARAFDRVKVMREDVVHPTKMRNYLIRWSTWWSHTIVSKGIQAMLLAWVLYTMVRDPTIVWLGRGLLPWRMIHFI